MSFRERSTGAALGLLVAAHAAPALATRSPALSRRLGALLEDPQADGIVLTFDDGPHPYGTPKILDALDVAGAKATFFLVGEQVERRPRIALEIAERGHAIGVHCYRHRNLLRLSPLQTVADIARAENVIAEATGAKPTLYRPPYGILSWSALAYAKRCGWSTLLWSAWGRDWRAQATAESIAMTVNPSLRSGSIVLLHDADFYGAFGSWRNTLEALPAITQAARERGLQFALTSAS